MGTTSSTEPPGSGPLSSGDRLGITEPVEGKSFDFQILDDQIKDHSFRTTRAQDGRCIFMGCGGPEEQHVEELAPTMHTMLAPLAEGVRRVPEGTEEGEVCVTGGHRPTVRGADGRCFICEPECSEDCDCEEQPMEPVDIRTYCTECGCWDGYHEREGGCTECECRIGEAVRPPDLPPYSPDPLPGYAVTYTVEGGQRYTIAIPGDASVTAVDGILKVYHPKRPVLGIVGIVTQPTLTDGEEEE